MANTEQHQSIKDMATAEENTPTSRGGATLPFGNKRRKIHARMQTNFNCRCQRCCVSSKAALLILLWNFILVASLKDFLDPNYFGIILFRINDDNRTTMTQSSVIIYSVVAFLFLFYPLAGCLADIRCHGEDTKLLSIVCVLSGGV